MCLLQSLLSVTEELHSLSFEASFTVQGLIIDLEVSSREQLPDFWPSVIVSDCV